METQPSDSSETGVPPPKRRGVLLFVLFVGLILFHVGVNVWWLGADNHVIRADEEGHMGFARDYYRAMALDHPGNLFRKLIAMGDILPTHPIHPPLLHVLGAVMVMLFWYSVDVITATNTVLFVAMLVGCYFIARRFLAPWPSLYVVFVVSFTPVIYSASRHFMTDYLSMTIVVWAIYALLRSDYFRNPGWIFIFAILNGLGLLTRSPTFLYFLLPSMIVFFVGVCTVLSPGKGTFVNWKTAQRLFFTATMTIVVTVGIASPWYYRHMESFYPYWAGKYGFESTVVTGSDVQLERSGGAPKAAVAEEPGGVLGTAPEIMAAKSPARAATSQGAARTRYAKLVDRILHPGTPWNRYPTYLINQGVFLPMFILSLIGALLALVMRRYRSLTSVILVGWVFGSWVFMTVLFQYSTPRYTLQVVPALAILAAMAVMAPPWAVVRKITMSAFALLLLFQYGNLSVRDYGRVKDVFLPLQWDELATEKNDEPGLALYKSRLTFGFAYSRMSAPITENYKDTLFKAMLRHEKEVPLAGEYANYVRLRMRGMEFDEQHYWPGSNPFRQIREEDAPGRKLHSIGMGNTPEQLVSYLEQADYVVYYTLQSRVWEEEAWHEFFEARGFEVIERFDQDRYGQVLPRIYGVMARRQAVTKVAFTEANLAQLPLPQLYEVIHTPTFSDLSAGFQQFARDRFEQLLAGLNFREYPMSNDITLVNLTYGSSQPGSMTFEMLYRVERPLVQNYRMYFRGTPPEGALDQLPPEKRVQGFMDWDFNPATPTSQWRSGDYALVTHTVEATGVTYHIQVGFMSQSGKAHGGQPPTFVVTFP